MRVTRYSKKIIQYFQSDKYIAILPMESKHKRIVLGAQSTYNLVHLYYCLSKNNKIARIRYKALASGVLIALTAWLCEQIEGKTLAQLSTINAATLIHAFELPEQAYQHAFFLEEALTQLKQCLQGLNTNQEVFS